MKIGVSAFAWTSKFRPDHLDLLPSLRQNGLDGFEIPMFDPADLATREIRRAFEANDLECTVCAILPVGINPISQDATDRKRAVAHLSRCIEASAEMGASLIAGPLYAPIGYLPEHRRNVEEWKWAVEYFQSIGQTLDSHKITLALEPVNRSETFFIRTSADAMALCDAIAHPRIGVTIDTFHANIEEKNIAAALASLGPRLKHVHISENDRGLLGSGHIDFPRLITALNEMKFDGYLMIEGFGYSASEPASLGALWADPTVSPESIAFRGATYLRQILASISKTMPRF